MPDKVKINLPSILLILALLGLLIVLGSLADGPFKDTLLHACEGALIGGLCDWFAVAKTFQSIENNRDALADQIANFVKDDIIGTPDKLRAKVQEIVRSPDVLDTIIEKIELLGHNKNDIRDKLMGVFQKYFYESTVKTISEFRFQDGGDLAQRAFARIVENKAIDYYARTCVAGGLREIRNTSSLKKLVASDGLIATGASWVVNGKIEQVEKQLFEGPTNPAQARLFREVIQDFFVGYQMTWDKLDSQAREAAVNGLTQALTEIVADEIAIVINSLKDNLGRMYALSQDRTLSNFIELVVEKLNTGYGQQVQNLIASQLKALPAKEFRQMIETRTLKTFNLIRINGTLLGCLLGGIFGFVLSLIH